MKTKADLSLDGEPRFFLIWRDGANKRVTIPVADEAAAITLRAQLYKFRTAMSRAKHPDAALARMAKISISPDPSSDHSWLVVIYPKRQQFDEALSKAGYREEEPPDLD